MKWLLLLCAIISYGVLPTAHAEETVGEKIESDGRQVQRQVKKGAHRVEETFCTGTKAECAGKKIKNRVEEVKDSTVDTAKDIKNKVN